MKVLDSEKWPHSCMQETVSGFRGFGSCYVKMKERCVQFTFVLLLLCACSFILADIDKKLQLKKKKESIIK